MAAFDVRNSIAVRDYVALKAPLATNCVLEQKRICTPGLAFYGVIYAHHRAGFAFRDRGAERGQVRVFHVVFGYVDVEEVSHRFGSAMHRIVLGCSDDAVVYRVVSLHAGYKRHAHAAGEEWVFAVCLLAAAPAGIAKDVDIRRPKRQSLEDVGASLANRFVMLGAAFGTDDHGDLMQKRRVPGNAHGYCLRKHCSYAAICHAVECFAPPVICGNLEARDGTGLVD